MTGALLAILAAAIAAVGYVIWRGLTEYRRHEGSHAE